MPIYAYRCTACGHAKDVLQKLSDALLTQCPACGAETFAKQVTAAGFQLKGSGWYASDFKGGAAAPAAEGKEGKDGKDGKAAPANPGTPATPAASPAPAAATPAATPVASSGSAP